ncbi:MAG: 2Fe-2S iron-sulfur cluster binding domain-containing protein [Actinobacteria bacterium]|nr:2Fe-2S iron-sulfur cluster binding domain-containing protein [Actinomycetota bacterium]
MPALLNINGEKVETEISNSDFLLETLRDLGLTSVRGTCGIGICGTCTVLVDGRAISSCITLTALHEGREIVTSEGLVGPNGALDEVQERFVENNAFQCSYCIPAMVLMVRAYLDGTEDPTVEGAREALGGNLCRCGTYPQVLEALEALIPEDPV